MTHGTIDPEENGTAVAPGDEGVAAMVEPQPEARVEVHNLRPDEHVSAVRLRANNDDLDKFRHLFGPKRRGR